MKGLRTVYNAAHNLGSGSMGRLNETDIRVVPPNRWWGRAIIYQVLRLAT